MTHTIRTGPMDCTTAQELLPDYLEGELAGSLNQAFASHLAACDACAALVADLRGITAMAAALPVREPARDLWPAIAARIEAPVVPLVTGEHPLPLVARRGKGERHARRMRPTRQWWLTAAAALVLVAGTAVVTRQLTLQSDGAAQVAAAPATNEPVELAGTAVEAVPPSAEAPTRNDTSAPRTAPAAAGGASTRLASAGRPAIAASPLEREIGELRTMLEARGPSLDSTTIRVLEQNLRIIDAAILESRQALLSDPASGLLNRQLNEALSEKLDLMRTAVLLSGD